MHRIFLPNFFQHTKDIVGNLRPNKQQQRNISFAVQEFQVAATNVTGKIIRCMLPEQPNLANVLFHINNTVIQPNKNCLIIGTTPSRRSEKSGHPLPGHNFSCAINNQGKVEGLVSKRPLLTEPLGRRERMDDPRLNGFFSSSLVVYKSKFSQSIQEDIAKACEAEAPLYFQIFPFDVNQLGLTLQAYVDQSENVLEDTQYTLLSARAHPNHAHFTAPLNCNDAVTRAVFGHPLQKSNEFDYSCQRTAEEIGKLFAFNYFEYKEKITLLELNRWEEPTEKMDTDLRRSIFLC